MWEIFSLGNKFTGAMSNLFFYLHYLSNNNRLKRRLSNVLDGLSSGCCVIHATTLVLDLPINHWALRNNTIRINGRVTLIIVGLDMIKVDS